MDRIILYGMVIPMMSAFVVLSVILLPAGDHLGWTRFCLGFGAFTVVAIGGAVVGGRYAARR